MSTNKRTFAEYNEDSSSTDPAAKRLNTQNDSQSLQTAGAAKSLFEYSQGFNDFSDPTQPQSSSPTEQDWAGISRLIEFNQNHPPFNREKGTNTQATALHCSALSLEAQGSDRPSQVLPVSGAAESRRYLQAAATNPFLAPPPGLPTEDSNSDIGNSKQTHRVPSSSEPSTPKARVPAPILTSLPPPAPPSATIQPAIPVPAAVMTAKPTVSRAAVSAQRVQQTRRRKYWRREGRESSHNPKEHADKDGLLRGQGLSLQWLDEDSDTWIAAVLHNDLRDGLLQQPANDPQQYSHARAKGDRHNDRTSYLPAHRDWDGDRSNWCNVAGGILYRMFEGDYTAPQDEDKPNRWFYEGRIVVDQGGWPVLQYDDLPNTILPISKVGGWKQL